MSERPASRLYIPQAIAAGGVVELEQDQAHKLRTVLRLADGAAVAAFNQRDGEWLCRLEAKGRRRTVLHVMERRREPEPEPDLWLVFAPIKRTRLDWLVEKATELGVAALLPVMTSRTQPERLNRERLLGIAVSAAEQSERFSLPEIAEPRSLAALLAGWPAERRLFVCDETGAGAPVATALAAFQNAPAALLIGPEGGLAQTELDALGKLPIVTRVGLGPRVLRAETAAIAALAVFQAVAGDWRRVRTR